MFGKSKRHKTANGPRHLIVEHQPKSPISEQFRTIRTNITYSSVDHPIQSLLVTSVTPGEGKSTIAANLAAAYAQSGKRTLLIEADLRRPTIHYTFELPNNQGITTGVIRDISLADIIRSTDSYNLDVIPSGPIPPNPSELLSSKKMSQVLNTLSLEYDMVILDSPPLLAVTDAQILSQMVDGTILVTDVESNDRNLLLEAKGLLDKVNANILGVVMNNKRNESKKDSYYYYYGSEQRD